MRKLKNIIQARKPFIKRKEKKKQEIIHILKEQEISEEIQSEFIEDKILEQYYEKETKLSAKNDEDKYTEKYYIWKESAQIPADVFKLEIQQYLKEIARKDTKKDLIERRLEKISDALADIFPLHILISADKNEPEGNAVHGFLMNNYPDYKDLIRKYFILDRAMDKARKKWKPTPYVIVEKVHLKECVKTIVDLNQENRLEHESELPFDRVIVYAKEPVEYAVDWNEGVPKEVNGFPTTVNLGYSNLILLDRAMWNTPMVFIAHAPGKDNAIKKIEFSQEEIEAEKEDINQQMIAELIADKKSLTEKSNYFQEQEEEWRKNYTFMRNKLKIMQGYNIQKKVSDIEKSLEKDVQKFDKGSIALIGGVVAIIIVIVIIMILTGGGV